MFIYGGFIFLYCALLASGGKDDNYNQDGPFLSECLKTRIRLIYLHKCWQTPGSWHGGWCGIHLKYHFLPACLWPVWQYPGICHSYSSSAKRSSQAPPYYRIHTLEDILWWSKAWWYKKIEKQTLPKGTITYLFCSISLPKVRHDCNPMVISVNMSAIFFCISWFLASGTPNWILIEETVIL